MARAAGIVAMGGYNTFCEILSFNKPALIVPRTAPRLEQFIRAQRAAELGLVAMLSDSGSRDPSVMAAALLQLPHSRARRPSSFPGCSTAWTASIAWRGIGCAQPPARPGALRRARHA